jgi:hypothetical protein
MTLGLVAGVCALSVGAASASAHNFSATIVGKTISPAEPGKLKGKADGVQKFTFGPIKISCPAATTAGLVSEESPTILKVTAKYKAGSSVNRGTGCETQIKIGAEPAGLPTRFVKPIEFAFNANGIEAEVGTEGEEEGSVEVGANSAEIKISGIKCLINWPAQKIPLKLKKIPTEVASFAPEEVANGHMKLFPSGFQTQLLISPKFSKMEYSFQEGECAEFKTTEGKTGTYEGTLKEELINGNLSWQ